MRFRAKWSSGSWAAVLLLMSACSSPQSKSSLTAGAGGESEAFGASSCDQASAPVSSAGAAGSASAGRTCGGTSSGGAGGTAGVPNSSSGGASVGGAGAASGGREAAAASATGGSGAGAGGVAGMNGRGGNGTGGILGKCELLSLQASAALAGAQTCYTSSGKPFCTGYTTNECGCKVPVNDAEALDTEVYVKARDAFTASCNAACTSPCVEPKGQTCQLILGLVVGSCVAL